MKRFLPAVVVAAVALVFIAEAKSQYPYQGPYGSYGGMNVSLGGGNFYNFGSAPYGSYSGMNLNLGGGSYYNTGWFTPYSGSRIGPYRHEHGGYGCGVGGLGYY